MTIVVLNSSTLNRNQSLLHSSSSNRKNHSSRGGKRFTEVAGGATAECAAVACCCPCGIVNLLVLVMYKVPAGLFRKALRHKRRQRIMKRNQKSLLPGPADKDVEIRKVTNGDPMVNAMEKDDDMIKLEKEMWDQFYQTGFWRSPSRRLESFGR